MTNLERKDLYSLEQYAEMRPDFRKKIMAHKKNRRVQIGLHATLLFEDRLTMQYQIQEMLRIEKIFEAEAIQEELDSYNPLIPEGSNWKATLFVEYPDVDERKDALAQLIGIESCVWIQIGDCELIRPIVDEDLERDTEDKTSAVHFLRFELDDTMVTRARAGDRIRMGIDHKNYQYTTELSEAVRQSLLNDLS
ncbi:MAG: DUF3501 family protein [Gammaproteobacteria bacterium]|nr:MAG: DUF3501 family protein [Gammaproteobacteria bacterium]